MGSDYEKQAEMHAKLKGGKTMDEKTRKHGSVIEMQQFIINNLREEVADLLADLAEIDQSWKRERELRLVAEEKWLAAEEQRCTCGDKPRYNLKVGGTC